MKFSTAVALVSAVAGVSAAPATRRFVRRDNSTSTAPYTYQNPAGFIFPTVIKIHDINTNLNTPDSETYTLRRGGAEKTTHLPGTMDPQQSSQPAPSLSLSRGTVANAPYTKRPPSPPYIHVPAVAPEGSIRIVPSYEGVDSENLTDADLSIITQNQVQIAHDNASTWRYEARRQAQPILDFLYLGPSYVAKDAGFLRDTGITMLIAARDSRMAEARLMSVDRNALALGITTEYVDVSGNQELIRAFPLVVKKINDHLLDVYRSQAVRTEGSARQAQSGEIAINQGSFRRGKVLMFCETGNDRSAAIAAAYIMSLFNMDLVRTLQFIGFQRFCVNFDEETKQWLRSYEDILRAKRMVARSAAAPPSLLTGVTLSTPVKRGIGETLEREDQRMESTQPTGLDMARYTDRPAFTPFMDGDAPMQL